MEKKVSEDKIRRYLSIRKQGEARMDRLRGLTRTQELGRRVAEGFFDVADVVAKDIRAGAPLVHIVQPVDVPTRVITDTEYAIARQVCDEIDAKPERGGWDTWVRRLYAGVCDRYQSQQAGTRVFSIELHVLRLGDAAIATNPFELYVDYGQQIQARSAAEQTLLIQLAAAGQEDPGYVPTPRAIEGGNLTKSPMDNYSATVMSDIIGPEGGQVLVDRTVDAINRLFK